MKLQNIQNIDVTLRDGGYQNNFNFSMDYVLSHVKNLYQAGVNWIEIGYRNGSFKKSENIGITGLSPNSYIETIKSAVPAAKLCVIAHPHNINSHDIDQLANLGVSMLRICSNPENILKTVPLVEYAKHKNLTVCVNLTRISLLSPTVIMNMVQHAEKAKADVIYMADSNGSLQPEKVSHLVKMISTGTLQNIGFHAHDNLGLAMTNSIAANKAGAKYIDSSLTGMGKGIGNLKLESWLSYLSLQDEANIYKIKFIFEQITLLCKETQVKTAHNILDMILGYYDLPVDFHKLISDNSSNIGENFLFASELKRQLI